MDINEIISSLSEDDINSLKSVADSVLGSGEKKISCGNESDMLGGIGELTKMFAADDDRTALIKAIRPMLSEARQQKADEAIKMLRLIRILPILRDSGFLKGLF